jgi:hypothetical protein
MRTIALPRFGANNKTIRHLLRDTFQFPEENICD